MLYMIEHLRVFHLNMQIPFLHFNYMPDDTIRIECDINFGNPQMHFALIHAVSGMIVLMIFEDISHKSNLQKIHAMAFQEGTSTKSIFQLSSRCQSSICS